MCRIKILGAGSIGNHMAHAARRLEWDVAVCDVSREALERMKRDIYPKRYGHWDDAIHLCTSDEAPRGSFDVIHVGTPPESHLPLALESLAESPRAVLVEKPVCPPDLAGAQELWRAADKSPTRVFVGFDHVVGRATRKVEQLLADGMIGDVKTLDVEFREHWGGIFAAHWWLDGPADSYLGYTERGGGASGEHSHATNLWQHFAHSVGGGRVTEVNANMQFVHDGEVCYDELCLLQLVTENGLCGRVVQDVITRPSRKRAVIQGTEGAITWINNHSPGTDAVIVSSARGEEEIFSIEKTRPDDFIDELRHVQLQLDGANSQNVPDRGFASDVPTAANTDGTPNTTEQSGIALERGLDTMLVLAAAHLSHERKCRVAIDHEQQYTLEALQPLAGEPSQTATSRGPRNDNPVQQRNSDAA